MAAAATKATAAQKDWAARPYTERAAVLRRAGQLFEQYADEIGEWVIREAGSIRPRPGWKPHTAAEECYNAAALAAPCRRGSALGATSAELPRRVPVGTVGVIAPFNFPIILSIRAVAPALALGNSVILKPDRARRSAAVWFSLASSKKQAPAGCSACCRAALTPVRQSWFIRAFASSHSPGRPELDAGRRTGGPLSQARSS
ncbi:unnamed protein product, partial [Mesorhabditis spiculigera]